MVPALSFVQAVVGGDDGRTHPTKVWVKAGMNLLLFKTSGDHEEITVKGAIPGLKRQLLTPTNANEYD